MDNKKNRRPESINVTLMQNGHAMENTTKLLNEANKWKAEYTDLPKYDIAGKEYVYSIKETEVKANDLQYYEQGVVAGKENMTLTNKYKLMPSEIESSIEKTGTEKITSSKQEVSYNIHYEAVIKDYMGDALVTIIDTLPYEID